MDDPKNVRHAGQRRRFRGIETPKWPRGSSWEEKCEFYRDAARDKRQNTEVSNKNKKGTNSGAALPEPLTLAVSWAPTGGGSVELVVAGRMPWSAEEERSGQVRREMR